MSIRFESAADLGAWCDHHHVSRCVLSAAGELLEVEFRAHPSPSPADNVDQNVSDVLATISELEDDAASNPTAYDQAIERMLGRTEEP